MPEIECTCRPPLNIDYCEEPPECRCGAEDANERKWFNCSIPIRVCWFYTGEAGRTMQDQYSDTISMQQDIKKMFPESNSYVDVGNSELPTGTPEAIAEVKAAIEKEIGHEVNWL